MSVVMCNPGRKIYSETIYNLLKSVAEDGQLWFAVGEGSSDWDSASGGVDSVALTQDRTKLVSEIKRVKIEPEDIVFVIQGENYDGSESEDIISEEPTQMIRINANINVQATLREYGVFLNSTEHEDSGDLLAYDVHPKIVLGQLNLYMKYIYLNF